MPLCAGLLTGGAVAAAGLWLLSGLGQPLWVPVRIGIVAVLVCAAVADDALRLGWHWPQNARQVPQRIRSRGRTAALLQFGFELGTGMRTFVTSSAPYVLVGVLVLGGLAFVHALAVGVGFGAGRALMPVLRARHHPPDDWDLRLARADRWFMPTATALTGVAALWLVAVVLG